MNPLTKIFLISHVAGLLSVSASAQQVRDLALDEHIVYAVPVSGVRVTTISFPSPIAAIDGALTTTDGKTDPIETSLEWGVRSLGKRVSVNAEGDLPAKAVADVFPAYDDDGGLLLVLTPEG